MPKAFSDREKELITHQLLEQGDRQFSTFGLKKTNVEEIAQAVGISKGAFYLFYDSKEAFFMDVVEQAEQRYRKEIMTVIDLPGPSPRARLLTILKKAFALLKTTPLLRVFTSSDFDFLARRLPPGKFEEHAASDQKFVEELIARCRQAGIPIQISAEEFSKLLYALVIVFLHEDDFGPGMLASTNDLFLELIVAYCLGEVKLGEQKDIGSFPQLNEGISK